MYSKKFMIVEDCTNEYFVFNNDMIRREPVDRAAFRFAWRFSDV